MFASTRSGNPDLWWIPARGGAPVQITTDPAADSDASWSPDGSSTWGAVKAKYR